MKRYQSLHLSHNSLSSFHILKIYCEPKMYLFISLVIPACFPFPLHIRTTLASCLWPNWHRLKFSFVALLTSIRSIMAAPISFRRAILFTRIYERIYPSCSQKSRGTLDSSCNITAARYYSADIGNKASVPKVNMVQKCLTSSLNGVGLTLDRSQGLSIRASSIWMVQRRLCSTSSRCWNCNAVLSNDQFQKSPFFCFSCHGIQPVDENISHFQRMEW